MPEYFYHVHIEFFSTGSEQISQSKQVLAPFMHSSRSARSSSDVVTMTSTSRDDKRLDQIEVSSLDDDISAGITTSMAARTRALYSDDTGIVHLYRDTDETPGLYMPTASHPWDGSASAHRASAKPLPKPEECTMLAVLAVPSYMSPKDFLAFVGADTRRAVSHIRMIRTSRLNRYMVLLKFKDARFARQWQHDWNGRVFNTMEPETCHVVYVRSVEVLVNQHSDEVSSGRIRTVKPLPPPTPSLVELPTCPVCLERMDESTGLLTVLCQHVFHCSCLEKWSGGGCPVCRYAHDDFSRASRPNTKKKYDDLRGEFELEADSELECGMCHIAQSLWQCLICGYVGCGRFAGKHAMDHYLRSGHAFAIDLESQRVWDYERDCYVHRIIANGSNATGEKLIELPGRQQEGQQTALIDADEDIDIAKRENLAFEYTQLLTSQLESQRVYFEEVVARAADKATKANRKADQATTRVAAIESNHNGISQKAERLDALRVEHEKEISRLTSKILKLEEQRRKSEADLQETKQLLDSISISSKSREEAATAQRNALFKKQQEKITDLQNELATRTFYVESLQEQCRDLRMQLELGKQMSRLIESGQLTHEEWAGATVSTGPSAVTQRQNVKKTADTQEPTDEQIATSIAEGTGLGSLAAMVLAELGTDYAWQPKTTESDIIKALSAVDLVVKSRDGQYSITSNFSCEVATEVLLDQCLVQKISRSNVSERLRRAGTALGNNYEIVIDRTDAEIMQALISAGIVQPLEERGLYDSDDSVKRGSDAVDSVPAKKKKKSKKKKR